MDVNKEYKIEGTEYNIVIDMVTAYPGQEGLKVEGVIKKESFESVEKREKVRFERVAKDVRQTKEIEDLHNHLRDSEDDYDRLKKKLHDAMKCHASLAEELTVKDREATVTAIRAMEKVKKLKSIVFSLKQRGEQEKCKNYENYYEERNAKLRGENATLRRSMDDMRNRMRGLELVVESCQDKVRQFHKCCESIVEIVNKEVGGD